MDNCVFVIIGRQYDFQFDLAFSKSVSSIIHDANPSNLTGIITSAANLKIRNIHKIVNKKNSI